MTLKPEHIVEELNRTPKLKRDLIMKMMEVMLDSEAFLEAYPTLYDPRIADVDLEYAHYPVRHSTGGGSIFLLGVRYGF